MMEWLFAPLEVLRRDLERINPVKKDVDRIAAQAKLPPLPGPPGIPRRTEEERVARHQAAYGEPLPARGTGFQRLLDPSGCSPEVVEALAVMPVVLSPEEAPSQSQLA